MKTFRALGAFPLGIVLAGCTLASPAFASGGKDIASAPIIAYGQQQFDNLTNGAVTENSCGDDVWSLWWQLPVAAGDRVVLDWEAQVQEYTALLVYPVGTTDYTYPEADAVSSSELNANNKAEARFTARAAGLMPVRFTSSDWSCLSGEPGPYDFTAYVTHGVALSMTGFRSVKHTGTVVVSARTPDGGVINDPSLFVDVQMKRGSHWATIGSAPVVNSLATVHLNVPKRLHPKRVTLRARDHGAGYLTRTSAHRTVKLRPLKAEHKKHHKRHQ